MAKLYPPYIEGTIPAFCEDSKGRLYITVPFSMNKSVSKSSVDQFYLKVKNVQSNNYIDTITSNDRLYWNFDTEPYSVKFLVTNKDRYKIGQHYKIQLAYSNQKDGVGYYSTVGVIKYTNAPIMQIQGLQTNKINMHQYTYSGYYAQKGAEADTTEKAYSYKFILYGKHLEVLEDTGWLLHNSANDENSYESYDTHKFPSDLDVNITHYIQYKVTTNNNMVVSTPMYRIMQKESIQPEIDATIHAKMNYDNGYVDITLIGNKDKDNLESSTTGAFLITRACNDDDYRVWNEVHKFVLHGEKPSRFLWRDFTVEQGKKYIYSLQQYNDSGIYSKRILSEEIYADFEDAFLYDGEKQLKIRYNPKVSSFKTDLLESKVETIGSKYPFIFRNGNVSYKEFPISGLISYMMDEQNLFIEDKELGLSNEFINLSRENSLKEEISSDDDEYFFNKLGGFLLQEEYYKRDEVHKKAIASTDRTTNLVSHNLLAERLFKLKVLDWLNDGRVKLFRSPSEGNYMIRLMNVSLSPEDKLGRMLHNFNATAYEIADFTYDNMNDFNIISVENPDNKQMRWASILVADQSSNYVPKTGVNLLQHAALTLKIEGMMPGDVVYIDDYKTVIGATGAYYIEKDDAIKSVVLDESCQSTQAIITYSFYSDAQNVFNSITDIDIQDIPIFQYIGGQNNIVEQIEDIRTKLISFYFLRFVKRTVDPIYFKQTDYKSNNKGLFFVDDFKKKPFDESTVDKFSLYRYELPVISFGARQSLGVREMEVIEPDFIPTLYYQKKKNFSNESYNGSTININYRTSAGEEWASGKTYYVESPYIAYKDLTQPNLIILDPESYGRIKAFTKENEIAIPSYIIEYSNKVSINNHILDLTEIEHYEVKGPIAFEEVSQDAGVVSELGFDGQIINYSVENNENRVKQLKQEYLKYAEILTPDKRDEYCLERMGGSQQGELKYNKLLQEARENYKRAYSDYVQELEVAIDEWLAA